MEMIDPIITAVKAYRPTTDEEKRKIFQNIVIYIYNI